MRPRLDRFKDYPRFSDGRIDYHEQAEAAALTCVVTYKEEVLVLKRSKEVSGARGMLHGVAGFLDEEISIEEKARAELEEETGITNEHIRALRAYNPVTLSTEGIRWHLHPVHVRLAKKPPITLDWEHETYYWIPKDEVPENVADHFRAALNAVGL